MNIERFLYTDHSIDEKKGYGYTRKEYGPWYILILCLLWLILPIAILIHNPVYYFKTGYSDPSYNKPLVVYEYIELPPKIIRTQKIIEVDKYRLDPEMKIASEYIKSNYRRLPRIIADRIAFSVYTHARKWNINPQLVMGIIETESRFDPTLTSRAGAKGLMQVLTGGKHIEIDWDRIHNIDYNIAKGIEILRAHIKAVGGKLDTALSNYSGRHTNYVQEVNKNVGNFVIFREEFIKHNNKPVAQKD